MPSRAVPAIRSSAERTSAKVQRFDQAWVLVIDVTGFALHNPDATRRRRARGTAFFARGETGRSQHAAGRLGDDDQGVDMLSQPGAICLFLRLLLALAPLEAERLVTIANGGGGAALAWRTRRGDRFLAASCAPCATHFPGRQIRTRFKRLKSAGSNSGRRFFPPPFWPNPPGWPHRLQAPGSNFWAPTATRLLWDADLPKAAPWKGIGC